MAAGAQKTLEQDAAKKEMKAKILDIRRKNILNIRFTELECV